MQCSWTKQSSMNCYIGQVKVSEVIQPCLTLYDPMDCSLPSSSVHGIFQARILEWVAISFSRRSSWPRNWTQVSCVVGRHFMAWATREVSHRTNTHKKTPSCLANRRHNSTRKARVVKLLNKQFIPLLLFKVPKIVHMLQRLLAVLRICSCSSVVNKPWILADTWQPERGPLSPASGADRCSHVTKARSVETNNNQDLPLPYNPGLGGCQLDQGHMQWSNKKESGSLTPWRITLALGLVIG